MLKGTLFLPFALFLLVVIAILVPFGAIISYRIAIKCGIISKNNSLGSILGSFSDIFSKKRSNIAHLGQNVVLLDSVKTPKKRHLPKQLQQLTRNLHLKLCLIYLLLATCILLTNLA